MSEPHTHAHAHAQTQTQTETQPGPREHEHERVAALVRAVDVRAPQSLHDSVKEMVDARTGARPGKPAAAGGTSTRSMLRARLRPTLVAMAVAACAGAAVALLSASHAHAPRPGPNLSAATRLTLGPATAPAPQERPGPGAQLNVAVDGVTFPYWEEHFGWRASGMRTDTLAGRPVTTVYYAGSHGSRIGYAIVSGTPAPAVSGGKVVWRNGAPYRVLREGGAQIVTWHREGRLCVLASRDVGAATLVRLAAWGEGAAPA